jgi:hypothetical protein
MHSGGAPPANVSLQDIQTSNLGGTERPFFPQGSFNHIQAQNNMYQQYSPGMAAPGGSSHPFSATLPDNMRGLQLAESMNFNSPENPEYMTGYGGPTFGTNPSQLEEKEIKQETYPSQGMHSTLGRSHSAFKQESQQQAQQPYLDNSNTLSPSQYIEVGGQYEVIADECGTDLNLDDYLNDDWLNNLAASQE